MHGDLHLAHQRFIRLGRVHHRFHRQVLGIQQRVVLRLPVVRVNGLLEVTLAIEQADADESQPHVAGGFGVVAGQHAQPAGGDGQRLMETEFGGEIGDRILAQRRSVLVRPGGFLVHVGVEGQQDLQHAPGEVRVLQPDAQFVIGDLVQNGHRVVIEVLPAARGQLLKYLLRLLVPGPPEIPRQPVQAGRQLRQFFASQRFLRHSNSIRSRFPPVGAYGTKPPPTSQINFLFRRFAISSGNANQHHA